MMAQSINDGAAVLARLELPQRDVDRENTLTLSLQVVKDPRVLEEPAQAEQILSRTSQSADRQCRRTCILVLLIQVHPKI